MSLLNINSFLFLSLKVIDFLVNYTILCFSFFGLGWGLCIVPARFTVRQASAHGTARTARISKGSFPWLCFDFLWWSASALTSFSICDGGDYGSPLPSQKPSMGGKGRREREQETGTEHKQPMSWRGIVMSVSIGEDTMLVIACFCRFKTAGQWQAFSMVVLIVSREMFILFFV